MAVRFVCKSAGYYVSEDGRTALVLDRRLRECGTAWGIHHGDRVGGRAYAATLSEAKKKAVLLRDAWDEMDAERETAGANA